MEDISSEIIEKIFWVDGDSLLDSLAIITEFNSEGIKHMTYKKIELI
jgi:hypothetical protein